MAEATMTKPWKPHSRARTCQWCKSQRPGMQPLTIYLADGKPKRGYWHLRCFELERAAIKKPPNRGGSSLGGS